MTDDTSTPANLWTPRPVEETIDVYRDWAGAYDSDLETFDYRTPDRLTAALARHVAAETTVLDFGCGTGISGAALLRAGFAHLHGTDVVAEMVEIARDKNLYDDLWVGAPGAALPRNYDAIVAVGVVSLGAAPPETLSLLIRHLTPGGILAMSFNDPTIENGTYDAVLDAHVAAGDVALLSREHGPHLAAKDMGSDVIVLRRG
ncbi:class I SAM-dependent DNA methyltransferase [Salibaculum halophilum]|uniref:class I SAM-dependent DNA methyltransferase n=1 Tax=Salibaculum halophilum TaxID=1914408 RepID=UPI000A0FF0D5|nr:methyltransferase domain-containing protein [Salibaculum halophilum]